MSPENSPQASQVAQTTPLPATTPVTETKPAEGRERRRTQRFSCEGRVEITKIPSTGANKGKVRNLSLGGCYVEMERPFSIRTYVELTLQVHHHSFRVTGTVRKSHKSGVGIEFDKIGSSARQLLQDLITELERTGDNKV
jgi:c-di-GMP-binding flagellar brake protein YcgR